METESLEGEIAKAIPRPQTSWRKQHLALAHLVRFLSRLTFCSLLGVGLVLLVFQVFVVSGWQTDFCQDYIAAGRLLHGMPIYRPLPCWAGILAIPTPVEYDTHPPFAALFFLPFGFFPRLMAYTLWGLCCLGFYLASGCLLLWELGWLRLRGVALFVAGSLCWPALRGAEHFQNLPQVTLFLLVVAWLLERRGRLRWAGGLLGLATLLKLWPVVMIGAALLRRRWQVALLGGLILLLGTALTLPMLGLGSYLTYLGPVRANEAAWVPWDGNVSLVGLITRALSGFQEAPFGRLPPLAGPLSLEQAVVWGEAMAGLLFMGTLGFLWWCRRANHSAAGALLSYGLLLTVLVLVFPLSWFYGLITLLLPGATTILALRQLPRPPWWWFLLLGGSLLPLLGDTPWFAMLAVWVQHHVPPIARETTLLIGVPTYGVLLLAGLQAFLLWKARTLPPRPTLPPTVGQPSAGSIQHA